MKSMSEKVSLSTGAFIACLLLVAIGFGITASESNSLQQNQQLIIESLTPALSVIKSDYDGQTVNLIIENASTKKITAYAVSANDTYVSKRDFVYSASGGLSPGENNEHTLSVDGSMQNKTITVKILSVIFEDKSNDGDIKTASEILQRMRAEKSQLIKLLPKLQKALESKDEELPAAINKMKKDIESSPLLAEEQAAVDGGNSGAKYGKQDVINKLSELENLANSPDRTKLRDRAERIRDHYQMVISRL